jgi:isopentenyl-diphosphate delta-isomerase
MEDTEGSQYDPEQVRMMAEECIVIDKEDKAIGHASKKQCHLLSEIEKGLLHRAFSVCLFNHKNELLLQCRSDEKITFPACWTNTCCSHPLFREGEKEEKDSMGVKRAAVRKLDHELGVKPGTIELDELHFLTRIYYRADNWGDGKMWGEHEIDHILFCKKEIEFEANPNEVKATRWVSQQELRDLFANYHTQRAKIAERKGKGLAPLEGGEEELRISPWFHMICEKFLWGWWDNLDSIIENKGLHDKTKAETIHSLVLPKK